MPEVPYIIVDNVLNDATSVTCNRTAVTGFEVSKIYDNLHHTSFKTTAATSPITFTVTPSAHANVNCVIIDSKTSDTSGYYQVSVNGTSVLNTQTTQDIIEGVIILPFTATVALSSSTVTISLYTSLTPFEIRHVHLGYYRTIKNPQLPHDPIQDKQEFRTQDNQDGQIINNAPVFTQKILDASWTMISPTDWVNFDYLRTNSFYTATPFWFFLHPTSEPTVGFLYFWDQDSYLRQFELAGYRNFAVKAKANYSAKRTPDRYQFAFSKAMTFNGTDHKGTCTQFSCGTTHTIEFWIDQATPSGDEWVLYGSTGGDSGITIGATNIVYQAKGVSGQVAHGGLSSGSKTHFLINRSGTGLTFYKNNVSLGTATMGSSQDFMISHVGVRSTIEWLSAKLAHVRIYNWVLNSTQRARQYNSGLGNNYLLNGLYAAWEFDESGAGSLTTNEDNQEGTAARDLTIAGTSPVRAAW